MEEKPHAANATWCKLTEQSPSEKAQPCLKNSRKLVRPCKVVVVVVRNTYFVCNMFHYSGRLQESVYP